jgi:DNA invertase Pin-like site-specific DNA recombinase
MDGYIRVSRVMGREGDSYMSPSIQKDDIEKWAAQHEVAIARMEKDEDVSGGKAVEQRKLEALIKRIESGASTGIVVNHTDRFGRDALDAAIAIRRIHKAGGRMIATTQGLDSSKPESKIVLNFYLMMAEAYLDRSKQQWDSVKRRNLEERGLHVSGKPPFGYRRKDELSWPERPAHGSLVTDGTREAREAWKARPSEMRDGNLVVDPAEAAAVRLVFELRARGETYANIVRRVEDLLGKQVSSNLPHRIVSKRVYLGEAEAVVRAKDSPDDDARERITRKGTHEAIVSQELFDAAQSVSDPRLPNDGSLAAKALLSGLVRCAGCGETMHIKGRGPKGARKAFYSCSRKRRMGKPVCSAPANADVKMIDEYVVWLLSVDESGAAEGAGTAERNWLEAKDALRQAEDELEHWMANANVSADVRRRMIEEADAAISAANAKLWALDDPNVGEQQVIRIGEKLFAYAPWGESMKADRRTLQRYVGSVTVAKGNRWQPLSSRVQVRWADGSEADVPTNAEEQRRAAV